MLALLAFTKPAKPGLPSEQWCDTYPTIEQTVFSTQLTFSGSGGSPTPATGSMYIYCVYVSVLESFDCRGSLPGSNQSDVNRAISRGSSSMVCRRACSAIQPLVIITVPCAIKYVPSSMEVFLTSSSYISSK